MLAILLTHLFLQNGVLCIDDVTVDLLTPLVQYGESCGYMSCPESNPDSLNVHIVPATHAEMGLVKTFTEYYTGRDALHAPITINMKNVLDGVITALWSVDRRKFTFSDMPYFFHWWKNRDGTVRRMVYQLLRQGRLFFAGGGWSQSDESVASYHAIIDQYTYTLRKLNATFLNCGRPLVSWQVDNFGHSREYASLIAQMGFDGHFINPISYDDELQRMRSKSLEFVWRGSDDLGAQTDIFTHKLFDGYWTPPGFCFGNLCEDPLIITSDMSFSNVEQRVLEFTKLMLERQAPYYTTNHVMVIMGQRFGYSDADTWFSNIDKLIAGVNSRQRHAKAKLFLYYSTPACYLKAVQKAQPTLSTKQDDFFPMAYDKNTHSSGMFTSRPIIKLMAREIHLLLQIAKQLQLFGRLRNNDDKFEVIHWITGVIHDHSVLTGAMKPHVREYYTEKVHKAKEIAMKIFRPALNILRNASRSTLYYLCPLNVSSCWTISGDTSFIIVYNPLSWPVTLPIRLPVERTRFVLYGPNGEPVNHSIISIPDIVRQIPERLQRDHDPSMLDEMVFIADDIPPLGYRSYYLQQIARTKRSIIKKITKNKKKKYLTRQTSNMKVNPEDILNDIDYEYFEDSTYKSIDIQFGNVTKSEDSLEPDDDYILTPPPKVTSPPTTESTAPETTATTKLETATATETTESLTTATSITTNIPEYYDEPGSSTNTSGTIPDGSTRRMEQNGYMSYESRDRFIKNEYIRLNLNHDYSKITSMVLSNGVIIYLEMQMMLYISDDPRKLGTDKSPPGVYVFRPMDPKPQMISENPSTKVLKSDLVEEVHIKFAPYAGIAVKVYKGLPYVELDWVVGPIPAADGYGREVFIRYLTDMENNGVFYTDANGRQTVKRVKNSRATYKPITTDEIGSNFYPVSSKVYIEDTKKNIRFSVFPDRGEGCTSLEQGALDIMLHRRLFTDDSGFGLSLNESTFAPGLIVRGKHMLYLSKADYRPNKVFEKKFAKELELKPTVFTSTHPYYINTSFSDWRQSQNEYTALRGKLPRGIHVLTIEKWYDNMLIRLENYLEITDVVKNGLKRVYIDELFKEYKFFDCRETMLAANIWRDEYIKMLWNKGKFVKRFNDAYGNVSNLEFVDDVLWEYGPLQTSKGIELAPQQIRTFVCKYEDLTLV